MQQTYEIYAQNGSNRTPMIDLLKIYVAFLRRVGDFLRPFVGMTRRFQSWYEGASAALARTLTTPGMAII